MDWQGHDGVSSRILLVVESFVFLNPISDFDTKSSFGSNGSLWGFKRRELEADQSKLEVMSVVRFRLVLVEGSGTEKKKKICEILRR